LIDDEFKFGRRLHRQICRFCPAQNMVYVTGSTPVLVGLIWAVGREAAIDSEEAKRINRRQLVFDRHLKY
jgi:hypothetical protein